MPDWLKQAIGYGIVRWVVGTTLQTGVVVAAVMYFLQITTVSVDSRISDVVASLARVETKLDSSSADIVRKLSENSETLAGFSERFNSIDKEFISIRSELASGLNAVNQSLSLLDPTSTAPLRKWGMVHLAASSDSIEISEYPFLFPADSDLFHNTSLPEGASSIWEVELGVFPTRSDAERNLIIAALSESELIGPAIRKVEQSADGYVAVLIFLSLDQATTACERLIERGKSCKLSDSFQ